VPCRGTWGDRTDNKTTKWRETTRTRPSQGQELAEGQETAEFRIRPT